MVIKTVFPVEGIVSNHYAVRRFCSRNLLSSCLITLLLALWSGTEAKAQQALGTVGGTITDPSGAVVPNVEITVKNPATGLIRTTKTSSDGTYAVSELPAGTYVVRLQHEGFKTEEHTQIVVHATRTTTLSVQLRPGGVSTTIEVAASPLLNSVDTTNGYILGSETIESVPLGTGSFTQLAILSPGTSADFLSGTDTNAGLGNQSIWANGQRDTSNSFNINEVSANNLFSGKSSSNLSANRVVLNTGENFRKGGQIQTNTSVYDAIGQGLPTPPPETIQELQVNTSLYDVSQGANSGAHIDVRTRSGTNSYHGQVYYYRGTDWLNAAPFFYKTDPAIPPADKVPQVHRNIVGGTLGGPIVHNKLFFFTSYQFTRTTDLGLGVSQNLTVPAHLTSDRSAAGLAAVAQADFGTTIDPTTIDPAALKIMQFKLPNGQFLVPNPSSSDPNVSNATLDLAGNDVFLQGKPLFRADQFNTNVDYNLSDHDVLSAKYYFQRDPNISPFASSDVPGFQQTLDSAGQAFSLANNMSLNPSTTWEQRIGFVRERVFGDNAQALTASAAGINLFGNNRFPAVFIFDPYKSPNGGGNSLNIGPNGGFTDQGVFQNQFEPSTNLNLVIGRHTLSFGANWDYTQLNVINHANQIATLNFNDFPSFLLGQMSTSRSFLLAGATNRYYRANQVGAYAQDKLRLTKNLVVTGGLRFDYDGPLSEKYGNLFNFDSSKYQYDAATDTIVNDGLVVAGNNRQFHTPGTSNSTLREHQYGFAPRIGIAWSPKNNLVVRTGFGLYFDRGEFFSELSPGAGQDISGPFGVTQEPPLVVKVTPPNGATLSNPFGTTLPAATGCNPSNFVSLCIPTMNGPATGLLAGGLLAGNAPVDFGAYDPRNKLPYTENWTLDVQYQPVNNLVLTTAYVGNRGLHQVLPIPLNQPQLATASNAVNGQTSSYGWNVPGVAAENVFTFDGGNVDLRVPFIGYSPNSVSYRAIGISTYNALQMSATKRMSHGIQFGASYTWSHSLDESSALGLFFNGNNPQLPRTSYASSDYDRTHVLTFNYVFQLPRVFSGNSFRSKLANGWGLRGVTVLQSGQPFSIIDFSGGVGSLFFGPNDFITNPIVELAPGFTPGKALTGASGTNPNIPAINPAAFTIPLLQPGQKGVPPCDPSGACDIYETDFGVGGRNIFRQAFQARADISLLKETKLTERFTLNYTFDIFNLTNSPSFDTPNNNVSFNVGGFNTPGPNTPTNLAGNPGYQVPPSGQLGVVQHTIGSPRLIQMSLHLIF